MGEKIDFADLQARERADNNEGSLKRTLSRHSSLILLGIGAMIGARLLRTYWSMRRRENTGPAISALVHSSAGIVLYFAGLCYAEMASTVPVSGSAYTYAYATMGEFVAWVIGWDLILEYMVGSTTAVAIGWSRLRRAASSATRGIDLPAQLLIALHTAQ